MKALNVTIVHRIQGRIRLKLSRAPLDIDKFLMQVKKHDGINYISFNPISKTVLVKYTPTIISSIEIVVRVSIALSVEFGNTGVLIQNYSENRSLESLDYYSGVSILALLAYKTLKLNLQFGQVIEYNAGISTTLSILKHAWSEIQRKGIYDPEVVSVVYLLRALINGNILPASIITWLATFGRHLFEAPNERFLLDAHEVNKGDENDAYIDVTLKPIFNKKTAGNPFRMLVLGLGKLIGINDKNYSNILEQIKQMSRKHGNILEGINDRQEPVYMRIEY